MDGSCLRRLINVEKRYKPLEIMRILLAGLSDKASGSSGEFRSTKPTRQTRLLEAAGGHNG
jgi:hypothetical protein